MRWLWVIVVFSAGMVVMADEENERSGLAAPDDPARIAHSNREADCLSCHLGIIPEGNSHMISGNDDCQFCHDLVLPEPTDEVSWSSGSLFLTQTDDYVCIACHVEQDRSEQQASAHSKFGCTTCHSPHGSSYGKMFIKPEADLCGGSCHGGWDIGISHPVGEGVSDPYAGVEMSCVSSCHSMHKPAETAMLQVAGLSLCGRCHADKV